jgi:hypothetical protein
MFRLDGEVCLLYKRGASNGTLHRYRRITCIGDPLLCKPLICFWDRALAEQALADRALADRCRLPNSQAASEQASAYYSRHNSHVSTGSKPGSGCTPVATSQAQLVGPSCVFIWPGAGAAAKRRAPWHEICASAHQESLTPVERGRGGRAACSIATFLVFTARCHLRLQPTHKLSNISSSRDKEAADRQP